MSECMLNRRLSHSDRYTSPGDIVLDPFAGVGTVPFTAALMGRQGVGVENDGRALVGAKRLLQQMTGCRYGKDMSLLTKNLPETEIGSLLFNIALQERETLSKVCSALKERMHLIEDRVLTPIDLLKCDLQLASYRMFGKKVCFAWMWLKCIIFSGSAISACAETVSTNISGQR